MSLSKIQSDQIESPIDISIGVGTISQLNADFLIPDLFESPGPNVSFTSESLGSGIKYIGGVLHPNGSIYCPPFNSTAILEINTKTGLTTTTSITYSVDNGSTESSKYAGASLAPNNKIYCIPFRSDNILEIDPVVGIATTIPIVGSDYDPSYVSIGETFFNINNKYISGALYTDGKIYCAPYSINNKHIMVIDPVARVGFLTASFTTLDTDANGRFQGSVLSQDGDIYFTPFRENHVLKFNPVTGIGTTIPAPGVGNGAMLVAAGNLSLDGKYIYAFPSSSNERGYLKVDIAAGIASTVTNASMTGGIAGGIVASNGKVYCIPYDTRVGYANSIIVFDMTTETFSTFGNFSGSNSQWHGGVLGPNGLIYGIPRSATTVLIINPGHTGVPSQNILSGYVNRF